MDGDSQREVLPGKSEVADYLFGSQLTFTPNSLLNRNGTVLCSPSG